MTQNINILKKRYSFPEKNPELTSFYWSLDGGGREIIKEIIVKENISLMLEIGVFFGGSAKQWLDTSEQLMLIGVDPFPNLSGYFAKSYDRYQDDILLGKHSYESLLEQLQLENGTYLSVINNLWDYRDRFIPIPKKSPDVLHELNRCQVKPELIYIDSNHQLDELPIIEKIFPDAIITGNAWNWSKDDFFPVQEKVTLFAEKRGYEIQTSRNSWILRQKSQSQPESSPTIFNAPAQKELAPFSLSELFQLDGIRIRDGLADLDNRLSTKPCKIAYLGASVTAQKQGYRPNLHKLLCQHYQQPHVEINGAIGGVISGAAVFLMDDTVLQYKPDVCFIEYSTVDMAWNSHEIVAVIEGMVRKLQAIDCQICFLYLYRTKQKFAGFNQVISWYEEVAEFYRLPSINMGRYIEDGLNKHKFQFDEIFRDFVHNTPSGGKLIAEYLFEGLIEILQNSPQHQQTKISDRYLRSDKYIRGRIFTIEDSMIGDRDNYRVRYFEDRKSGKKYKYFEMDDSNEIEFEVKGEIVAALAIVDKKSGIAEFITPEGIFEYSFWDIYCHYPRLNARPIDLSFEQKTKVRLRLTDKPVDYSTCRRTIENPELIKKSFKIIGLLVCGEVSAPPAKISQV